MKRRHFIKHVFKSGAGLLAVSALPTKFISANNIKQTGKLGVALVGLGRYSTGQLGPALMETEHCYLAGIVTGTLEKEQIWKDKYNIPAKNIYNYENFDRIVDNKDIDIVYVVLPNSMHAEFSIRASQAGKHVICEKPMAISVSECQKMIAASAKAGKTLSIGYRLHFDPYHLKMMELGQKKLYGKIQEITSGFAFHSTDAGAWRLNKKMAGGGPLVDLGIYALQGTLYTVGELPIKVTARDTTINTDFFTDVEGSIEWEFQFSSGIKHLSSTSYEDSQNYLKVQAKKGAFGLQPAFSYNGLSGYSPDGPISFTPVNQQAKQMDSIALSISRNEKSIVPGEMGMRDVYLMEKIYEAAQTGKIVKLDNIPDYQHLI